MDRWHASFFLFPHPFLLLLIWDGEKGWTSCSYTGHEATTKMGIICVGRYIERVWSLTTDQGAATSALGCSPLDSFCVRE